jgi:CBS domain-containing protein
MSLERFTRRDLVTATPDHTVAEVARLMGSTHVGAVVIVDGDSPIGIVTDRDLVLRALQEDGSATRPIRDFMTPDVAVARVDDSLDTVFFTMRQRGVRRVPIVDGAGALVGLVAFDDLLVLLGGEVTSLVDTVLDNRGP